MGLILVTLGGEEGAPGLPRRPGEDEGHDINVLEQKLGKVGFGHSARPILKLKKAGLPP